ncbi:hypothetical protein A3A40_02365 [Candidatus Kaiserbacteria bacterium RIFCSPLOWO2_01_FULL_54_20]|uniref:2,3-bisphosphoglycerate-dependent phosphoglycerate mutase n=1 Tax=Candidatus Kaiserbacteria bacterium RIFCSPLOWO2_01_FULL_54_20 TaxID=1798513 RepID=A0A1F6EJJ3_9BACT|nr:MAG: hypothetical protein A3A40_02365 [Candidatus Kaiserbacteria bacterium RIFCSPLOWO2_01_FULL_54_20]
MAYLILVRHGTSEWNALGLWQGWTDIPLAQKGKEDALRAAESLRGIRIDRAYTSVLKRAKETWEIMKDALGIAPPTVEHQALNERHYGIYQGKNKWQVKEDVGEEEFQRIRRSWDHPIPEGETLEDVYKRIVPYYQEHILPDLVAGKNVVLTAHGNSLRALVKYLEDLSIAEVLKLEFGIGEAYVYEVDEKGKVAGKEIRAANPHKGKV